MAVLPRMLFSLLGGSLVALALLWLMQWLLLADGQTVQARRDRPVMAFVRLKQDSRPEVRRRELPEPKPLPEEAPPPSLAFSSPALALVPAPAIDLALPKVPLHMDGPYLGAVRQGPPDRDFMVISRLPPRYPYRAQRQGIEGWVRVSFLITEQGEVKDALVVDADPKDSFDQAALRAVAKWRFKPRIEDGRPVAVRVEQVVSFKLNGGRQ